MTKVTPEEALSLYLSMGADRTIAGVRTKLGEMPGVDVVSERQFEKWSSRYGWAKAAEEFDAKAGRRLISRTQTAVVRAGFDRVMSLTMLAQRCLDIANAATLEPGELKAADVRALTSAAIDAIKTVEVLTGGVSDRTERSSGMATEAIELLRRLEAQKKARIIDITPGIDKG